MTLPDPELLKVLARDFVVGWKNIERESWCGLSDGYSQKQTALGTTNGAGGRNLQIFVLAPDKTVLHALPGFWHPDDLREELKFSRLIWALHQDAERSASDKLRMYRSFHDQAIQRASELTKARSDWQPFDRVHENWRAHQRPVDTARYVEGKLVKDDTGQIELKPLNEVLHERMRREPFQSYASFDVVRFVDYGQVHYDNNRWIDTSSKAFTEREKLERMRQRASAQAD